MKFEEARLEQKLHYKKKAQEGLKKQEGNEEHAVRNYPNL